MSTKHDVDIAAGVRRRRSPVLHDPFGEARDGKGVDYSYGYHK